MTDEPLNADDIMIAIGRVVASWGLIEAAIIDKLGDDDRLTPIQRLRQMRLSTPDLEAVARVRNLVAHGLRAYYAQPSSGEPRVVCRDARGNEVEVTYATLIASSREAHRISVELNRSL
jgi:hypothetical protein